MKMPGVTIYPAGVRESDTGDHTADGGRLLYVVGADDDIAGAQDYAYQAIKLIDVEGDNGHYRNDIGDRDRKRHMKHNV